MIKVNDIFQKYYQWDENGHKRTFLLLKINKDRTNENLTADKNRNV